MQNPSQYVPCPKCGSTDVKKVSYTWWGGALGPSLLKQVRCNNCKTEYNGKTGKSNSTNILIYFLVTFVVAFCVCGGVSFLAYFLNNS
jgi:hypothetical protein